MSFDLILKPTCGVCEKPKTDLYGSTCKHMTLCINCGKTMVESKASCYDCGSPITRLIREYNVRASTIGEKNYFIGRFVSGIPTFSKKKNSENKWFLQKEGLVGRQVTDTLREKFKNKPWALEEESGLAQYHGHLEGAQSASYYLLMMQGKEFVAIPAGSWYNFNKVAQYKQLTLEEAEEKMKNRRKTADGYQRWMMKAANNGPAAFGEVEKLDDKESGGGGRGGRKKATGDEDEGNVSDKGDEDEEEEASRKNRLGLNKRGGDDDDEEGLRGGDHDMDDDDIEKDHTGDADDLWCDDGSLYDDDSNEQPAKSAEELDREWQRRHNEFHTIGYRDGLTSGKEASAQEGFNIGFKESVPIGYKWGLVRGVSSALACLSDGLKEKLVENIESREKLQILYKSVNSVSTKDALDLYSVELLANKSKEHCKPDEGKSTLEIVPDETSSSSQLGSYSLELESLLQSSAIQVHSAV